MNEASQRVRFEDYPTIFTHCLFLHGLAARARSRPVRQKRRRILKIVATNWTPAQVGLYGKTSLS